MKITLGCSRCAPASRGSNGDVARLVFLQTPWHASSLWEKMTMVREPPSDPETCSKSQEEVRETSLAVTACL